MIITYYVKGSTTHLLQNLLFYNYKSPILGKLEQLITNVPIRFMNYVVIERKVKFKPSTTWSPMYKFLIVENKKNKINLISVKEELFSKFIFPSIWHGKFNFYLPKSSRLNYFNQPHVAFFDNFYYKLFINRVMSYSYYKNIERINFKFISDFITINKHLILNTGNFRSSSKYSMFKPSVVHVSNNGIDLDMVYLSFKYTPEFACARSKWEFYRRDDYHYAESNEYKNKKYTKVSESPKSMLRFNASNIVCLPSHTDIHLICGSKDVIHSWALPGLGIKIDCIPGFNSHKKIHLKNRGTFYGQCMEVCGRYHHWMPLIVKVTSFDLFLKWYVAFLSPYRRKEQDIRRNAVLFFHMMEEDLDLIEINDSYLSVLC